MKTYKRMFTFLLTAMLAVSSLIMPVYAENADNQEFENFLTQEFVDMCENDYLTMHYYVSDPAKFGITKPEATIGKYYTKDDLISENQKSLDNLHKFDVSTLSDRQKHDYSVYEFQLEAAIEQAKYHELDMSFDPGNNLASNIVTNMTEFVFRCDEDIDDYLKILASVPAYMDLEMANVKEQAAQGIFLTEDQLEETLRWFEKFTAKKDDNALIIDFNNAMKDYEGLDETKKNAYIEENKKIVKEQFIPCYEKLAKDLKALDGSRKYGDSVFELPNGKEYYAAKMKTYANCDKSVDELITVVKKFINGTLAKYMLVLELGNFDDELDETVAFDSPEAVLKHLEDVLEKQFPALENFTYHADYLDESIAEDNVLAYYMECPVDDATANSIKINGKNVLDHNSLYETLAHEGIAGHMYQRNYYMSTNPNPLRLCMLPLGYGEGWAMYAMDQMWDYAELSDSAALSMQINLELGYGISALVDLYVNGLGYDDDQVEEAFNDFGLNGEMADSYVDYAELYPLQLISYGVGMSYMCNMRKDAETVLGQDFNAKEYNSVILNNGPRHYELIEEDLKAYYESKGKSGNDIVDPVGPDTPAKKENSVLFYAVGGGIVIILAIALIVRRSRRKDDPFEA